MCGGGDVSYPGPSPDEAALQKAQLDLLNKQSAEIEGFKPLLLDQFGYASAGNTPGTPEYEQAKVAQTNIDNYQKAIDTGVHFNGQAMTDADNNYFKSVISDQKDKLTKLNNTFVKTPDRAASDAAQRDFQAKQLEVAKLQLQRNKDALEGKLPVSEQLKQSKDLEFQALKEQLGQRGDLILGDNADNAVGKSTSSEQALNLFKERYGLLEDSERRGIIQGEASLPGVYQQGVGASQGNMMTGAPNNSYYNMMPMYGQAMQPYMQAQQGQLQASMFNSQQSTAKMTGMMQLAGQLGGSAMGAAGMAAMSSKDFKKDITQLSVEEEDKLFNQLMSTPLNRYHYKDEDELVPRHVGFITEEAPPEVVTEDGKHLSIVDYFGVMTLALKVLNRKFDSLEQRRAA